MAVDSGLSNERTALAWQRTALALVAGAALLARLTTGRVGVLALVLLGLAVALSLWVFSEAAWRYEQHTGHRTRQQSRGGRAAFFLTAATVLIAVTEAVALTRA